MVDFGKSCLWRYDGVSRGGGFGFGFGKPIQQGVELMHLEVAQDHPQIGQTFGHAEMLQQGHSGGVKFTGDNMQPPIVVLRIKFHHMVGHEWDGVGQQVNHFVNQVLFRIRVMHPFVEVVIGGS